MNIELVKTWIAVDVYILAYELGEQRLGFEYVQFNESTKELCGLALVLNPDAPNDFSEFKIKQLEQFAKDFDKPLQLGFIHLSDGQVCGSAILGNTPMVNKEPVFKDLRLH